MNCRNESGNFKRSVVLLLRCRLSWGPVNVKIRCHFMLTVDNLGPVKAGLCMLVHGYVTITVLTVIMNRYYLGCYIFFFMA